jgi:hypothetical protein
MNSKFKKLYETLRPSKNRNTEKDAFIQWSTHGLCNIFALKTATDHDKILILTDAHTPKHKINSDWEIIHVIIKHGTAYYDAKNCYPSIRLAIGQGNPNQKIDYLETTKFGLIKLQSPILDHGFWKIDKFIDDKLLNYEFCDGFEILDNQNTRQEFIKFLIDEYYSWIQTRYAKLIKKHSKTIKKGRTLCQTTKN